MFKKTSFKLAIAQISTDPGDIGNNTKKIIAYIKKAKKDGAKIVIFPELTIPGYMSLDLMLYTKYIDQNKKALSEIKKYTEGILAIIGFIDYDKDTIGADGTPIRYNSAAILYNKRIIAIQDKTLLPNYDVFFENRYFSLGRGRKLINFAGVKLGIEICEDLWDENYPIKVSQDLIQKGADILINISGSPFYIGKIFDRQYLIKRVSSTYKVPFIYVNTVSSQDGYDGELVFDGQSMIFNKFGQLIKIGREFEEELFFIDLNSLLSKEEQAFIIPYDPIKQLYQALILAIKDYFRRTNFKKAFIGVSGGVDSAVVCALAVDALGKDNVTAVMMPSKFTSTISIKDAKKLAINLGVKMEIIPINKLFEEFIRTLENYFQGLPFDVAEENIQARIRGVILMAHANKLGGLVLSTANKTETALGYTTLYGDMCGAIAPLADVSKLKVYALANFINKEKQVIPENIIKKIPSAELREKQTDEASLGGPYKMISPLVDEIIEDSKTFETLSKKYPKKLVRSIINLINQNEYKRRQAAPAVKVTKKAFGIGRRIPISHNFSN